MLLNFIHWNVDPILVNIGSFGLRYYSLGFLFAFLLGYFIIQWMFKHEKVKTKYLDSLVIWILLPRWWVPDWDIVCSTSRTIT